MRLTKLKLAGFKSFVDPTTVALPGQLVGVVGPNGCGKSNIMDAVRWVLGESKASELRGESMQDVIFNGSSQRKPVSRASVELVFDNSLGRALGQWSQYSELAVKRVLTRNGQSEYFINQLKVRRKDITDLFLGTGLGPRAYAIIGQGMISRIIEARPEELRVFLEEAAGVTRYKERRKETLGRLADTKENLNRLEDIRQELGGQIERLQEQAAVARKYQVLTQALQERQQLQWLFKHNEAASERERLRLALAEAKTALEKQGVDLRHLDLQIEQQRDANTLANEAANRQQTALYEVNTDVTRLETELRFYREARSQYYARMAQLAAEEAHWQSQADKLGQDRERWEELAILAEQRVEEVVARLEAQSQQLPDVEARYQQLQTQADDVRRRETLNVQKLQIEQTHLSHSQRNVQTLTLRHERLRSELTQLQGGDGAELVAEEENLALWQERLLVQEEQLQQCHDDLQQQQQYFRQQQHEQQQLRQQLAAHEARGAALQQMQAQARLGNDGSKALATWLQQEGLAQLPVLWQSLRVSPEYSSVLELVLQERMQAAKATEMPKTLPPSAFSLTLPCLQNLPEHHVAYALNEDALLHHVLCDDPQQKQALQTWLYGIRVKADLASALVCRNELALHECFVTPQGECITQNTVRFLAPQGADAVDNMGVLARQQEIDDLAFACAEYAERLTVLGEQISDTELAINTQQRQHQALTQQREEARRRVHEAELRVSKLSQAIAHLASRRKQLQAEMQEIRAELEGEQEQQLTRQWQIDELQAMLHDVRQQSLEINATLEQAEFALREQTHKRHHIEREWQEAKFSAKECQSKLQDVFAGLAQAEQQLKRVLAQKTEYQAQHDTAKEHVLEEQLQTGLTRKQACEVALQTAREHAEELAQLLRTREEQRAEIANLLEPIRQQISELQLKEQAAALTQEQFAQQLSAADADLAALNTRISEFSLAALNQLGQEISRLQRAINELGAVNLAALSELEAAEQRKGFLDIQAADLEAAMNTLENAIRRIDRESRELLHSTFDTVNRHFGTLFPQLFGGGRAELLMMGEEILDAGVQVIAQPPGKKNSTIHLLSGGEKALTAIALVFAMFQLNPAPFCLLDEVDAPLDDTNTERFCGMVTQMSAQTQFLFISHNKIAMEMAQQLVGITMQESGVSRVVDVDIEQALRMTETV